MMRGSVAKRLRRYVRNRYAFLAEETGYVTTVFGAIACAPGCQRALYKEMKRNYKIRSKSNG